MRVNAILKGTLALLLLVTVGGPLRVHAQRPQDVVPEPAPKNIPGAKPVAAKLSGRVNDDGTIFISDLDLKSWKINNPDAIKHHRNEHVSVNVIQYPSNGSITVKSATEVERTFSH